MPITYGSGDPLLTQAQCLAFGCNALGRTELGAFETALYTRYPTAFSAYRKQALNNRVETGRVWYWRESKPMLAFLVVRASPVGATRLRYIQSAALTLARDYRQEGIVSLAIAPLGTLGEWADIQVVLEQGLAKIALPVTIYQQYLPSVQIDQTS